MPQPPRPGSPAYVEGEGERLLAFARNARLPGWAFGWLDSHGSPLRDDTVHMHITARMTHVFSLAACSATHGRPSTPTTASPRSPARSTTTCTAAGTPPPTAPAAAGGREGGVPARVVVLAAASATAAGRPGAAELLAQALAVIERRFREPGSGLLCERWDRGWRSFDGYRGANSNMHAVEALLAASDATGDGHGRLALQIADLLAISLPGCQSGASSSISTSTGRWCGVTTRTARLTLPAIRGHGRRRLEWSRLLVHLSAVGLTRRTGCSRLPASCSGAPNRTAGGPTGTRDSCTRWTGRAPGGGSAPALGPGRGSGRGGRPRPRHRRARVPAAI